MLLAAPRYWFLGAHRTLGRCCCPALSLAHRCTLSAALQFLCCSQSRRSRAWIPGDLSPRWLDCLLRQDPHQRTRFGRERRARAATCGLAESPLCFTAIETVVRQCDDSAARPGAMDCCVQCFAKRSEFVVHDDPQRHEGLRGCVKSSRSHPGWDCCCDRCCELCCGCDWMLLSCCDNRSCYSMRPPFPSVFPEDSRQLFLRQSVYEVRRSGLLSGIHPHVQWPVESEAEAPPAGSQLFERHAAVDEDPVHCVCPEFVQNHLQSCVVIVHQRHWLASQVLPRSLNRFRVPVDPDQLPPRLDPVQYRRRVPARTQGGVDYDLAWLQRQVLQDLLHHHRLMLSRFLLVFPLTLLRSRGQRPSP